MIKTKTLLLLFLSSFTATAQMDNIRAGNMRVEQVSKETVKARVNLYTRLHADSPTLELCWGDGNCEQWATSFVEEWPELDTRHYQMETFHAYQQPGQYFLSVESCCWADDLVNLAAATGKLFTLHTDFSFSGDDQAKQNSTPFIEPAFAVCPTIACSYLPQVNDNESDKLFWSRCLPDLEGFAALDEVAASPLNKVLFNSNTGSLSWVSPPFEGLYTHFTCLEEFREDIPISRSEYYTLLVVNNHLRVKEVNSPDFYLAPNPVNDLLFLSALPDDWHRAECKIYDLYGRLVFQQKGIHPIEVAQWDSGVYFLILEKEGEWIGRRFISHSR